MNFRSLLASTLFAAAFFGQKLAAADYSNPNIVVILADDTRS